MRLKRILTDIHRVGTAKGIRTENDLEFVRIGALDSEVAFEQAVAYGLDLQGLAAVGNRFELEAALGISSGLERGS